MGRDSTIGAGNKQSVGMLIFSQFGKFILTSWIDSLTKINNALEKFRHLMIFLIAFFSRPIKPPVLIGIDFAALGF